jgi:hypothetical protein
MSERQVSREIQDFLKSLGFAVWSSEQGYRRERGGTRTSAGIPDLIVMGHGLFTFVEVKTPKGKLTPAQQVFRDECKASDIGWQLWRDVRDAWTWCVREGLIEEAR